jgi:NodT family efflux transporter outer membrane factor (OMF) lipoprotein
MAARKLQSIVTSVTTAGALLALAGCSFMPAYERPAAPVAAAFEQAGSESGTPAATLAWRDFIQDERTRALVDIALRENRDLRVAVLNVEQARAALGLQNADRLPNVGVGVGGTRTSVSSTYSAGFVLSSFEIDLFGRVKSLSAAAAARLLATDEARRSVQLSLIAAVASAELALRADDELLAVTDQVLAGREETLRLVKVRFDGGLSGEPEYRAAESLVAAARVNRLALQRQRAQDLNALVLLLGQPLPAQLPPPRPLTDHRLASLPAGLPSDVLLQRPDVLAAEQQLIAANANIGAARAAFFPRITLTGSIGTASTHLGDLFQNTAWSFALQLLQPLFDAGRNCPVPCNGREIAVAQYEKAIQTAFREVADALAGRATLGAQREAQEAQAAAETRRLALADLLLKNGAASALDRLDAERALLAARQAVVQLQLAERQNALLLYRVLGGGALAP